MLLFLHMAEPSHEELLQETFKLARDNNRMLHAMRRNAFFGGVFKLITYALFIGVPLWFFATYLYPILDSAMTTLNQAQGQLQQVQTKSSEFGAQFESLNTLINQLKDIPGIGNFGE